jgi:HK97 family phage prohead protease
MDSSVKALHFDHDESVTISTTRNGLILLGDEYGVAMRLHVPRTALGAKAVALVRSNQRQALSVGVTMHDCDSQIIDGVEIVIVKRATLREVSLVLKGACEPAFAILVDADGCQTLEQDCKSLRVLSDGAYVALMRAVRKLQQEN